MSHSHDELREAIGAYVLRGLDDDLRAELHEHLAGCPGCRAELAELAPLREVLTGIDPDGIDVRPTPRSLDLRIDQVLARESSLEGSSGAAARARRRWVPAVAGLLVGAAAATIVAVAVRPSEPASVAPPGPIIVAVPDVRSATGVRAGVGLVDHTWGLELKLVMTGLPAGQAYAVHVIDDQGRDFAAGEFFGVDRTITCNMTSAVLLADASRFEVLDPQGSVVVAGTLPA